MLLRRATDATASGTREAFLDFWRHECDKHFRVEEEVLFPAYAAHAGDDDALLARALADHAEIRRRVADVESAEVPAGSPLRELGDRLSAHVRLEERELFPAIERALTPTELAELGVAIAGAERGFGG